MQIYLQDLQATLACGYSQLLTSILSVWVEENKYLCKLDVADQFLASNLRSKKQNFTLIVFVLFFIDTLMGNIHICKKLQVTIMLWNVQQYKVHKFWYRDLPVQCVQLLLHVLSRLLSWFWQSRSTLCQYRTPAYGLLWDSLWLFQFLE